MFLSASLCSRLWASCALSGLILKDGEIAPSLPAARLYRQAGFSGPVHTFCGGPSQIDAGLMGISQDDVSRNDLIMAFRGTTNQAEDWANDFRSRLVPLKGCGRVHEGFLSSVHTLLEPMAAQLPAFFALRPRNFYMTGHSKGGAVAILMAYELTRLFPALPVPTVITFGAPRPGDADFAECCSIPVIRVESCRDLVPHLPMTPWECSPLKELSFPGETLTDELPLLRHLAVSLAKPVCGYASPGLLAPICPDAKTGPASGAARSVNIRSGSEESAFSRRSFQRILDELAAGGDFSRLADWHKEDYIF